MTMHDGSMERGAPLAGRRIALAAGGTGGHMFPAEALASVLKAQGADVLLITDARGQRYTANFPADRVCEISAASPNVGGPVAKAAAALSMAGGLFTALRALRAGRIDGAVGFGGYPSLPTLKAAALLNIPYGVHEQNAVLGRANRLLVKGAAFTAHAFPDLEKAPAGIRHRLEVGNPVRDAVLAAATTPFATPERAGPLRILVFGGSQGASLFSAVVPEAMAALAPDVRRRLTVVHQARDEDADRVREVYLRAGISVEISAFFNDLPARIADAHLVIARAGASTVTELSVIGRPAVLVPLAIAMDDHQYGNARVLSSVGAAEIILEKAFDAETLTERLGPMLDDPVRLAAMAEAARGRVSPRAAHQLAGLVKAMVLGETPGANGDTGAPDGARHAA